MQDWDDPPTCINWPEFRSALAHIRSYGKIPEREGHDHLNKLPSVGVDEAVKEKWRGKLAKVPVTWVIVDGFMLYWDKVRISAL